MKTNICRFIEHFCGKPFDIVDCCNVMDYEQMYRNEYSMVWEEIFNTPYDKNTMIDYIEDIIEDLKNNENPLYNGDFIEDCIIYDVK